MTAIAIGANQAEVKMSDGRTAAFSYGTLVAVFVPGRGALCTDVYYSRTTSKHISQALRRWGALTKDVVPQEYLNSVAEGTK